MYTQQDDLDDGVIFCGNLEVDGREVEGTVYTDGTMILSDGTVLATRGGLLPNGA